VLWPVIGIVTGSRLSTNSGASISPAVSNGADGAAALDLRGLGAKRTLVLVDGLRLGPGSADGRNWSDCAA
jgi:outer membrane receptor for ferrienterochelin and colicin